MSSILRVETTPNPNSRKFVCAEAVASSTKWFGSAGDAAAHPLAAAIFGVDGVANVMLLNDFVTIGKTSGANWDALEPAIVAAIDAALS